jgi:hypothetical protein
METSHPIPERREEPFLIQLSYWNFPGHQAHAQCPFRALILLFFLCHSTFHLSVFHCLLLLISLSSLMFRHTYYFMPDFYYFT